MSDLFTKDETVIDPNKDYLSDLVGEGKKYKDPAAMAFGVVNAQAHIAKLESETKTLRDELQKRSTAEEILKKITEAKTETPSLGNPPVETNRPQGLDQSELLKLIAEQVANKVKETDAEREYRANFEHVKSELQKLWGNDWQEKLQGQAKSLGLGQEWLTQLAGAQPKAFLSLMGVQEPKPREASPFSVQSVNTAAFQTANRTGEKTQKYYNDLKLKDPVAYAKNQKAIHAEQMAQALKLGEAFFDA